MNQKIFDIWCDYFQFLRRNLFFFKEGFTLTADFISCTMTVLYKAGMSRIYLRFIFDEMEIDLCSNPSSLPISILHDLICSWGLNAPLPVEHVLLFGMKKAWCLKSMEKMAGILLMIKGMELIWLRMKHGWRDVILMSM